MKRFLARVMSTAGVVAVSLVLQGCSEASLCAFNGRQSYCDEQIRAKAESAEQASHIAEIGGVPVSHPTDGDDSGDSSGGESGGE